MLMEAGMNVCRFNFSHGEYSWFEEVIAMVTLHPYFLTSSATLFRRFTLCFSTLLRRFCDTSSLF